MSRPLRGTQIIGTASLLALAGALASGGCDGQSTTSTSSTGPRLFVLFIASSLNREMLEPHGAASGTPALARLAEHGLVFDRHQTEAGQTEIARASLLGGVQAWGHGVYGELSPPLGDALRIDAAFARAGWETRTWSAEDPAFGGEFEVLLAGLAEHPGRRAFVQVTSHRAQQALAAPVPASERPQVITALATELGLSATEVEAALALYDANRHALQWDPPGAAASLGMGEPGRSGGPRLARVLRSLYARAVREVDTDLGRCLALINTQALASECLFAFTADQGEVLDRPTALFRWSHGLQLAPEVITVPLVLRGPGVEPGRYAGVSRSIDVFPTLAGLAGLLPAGLGTELEGTDLGSAVRGERAPPEQRAFSHTAVLGPAQLREQTGLELRETYFPSADPAHMWMALRTGDDYFLLRKIDAATWALQVYDLAVDPWLEHDLFDAASSRHAEITNELASYRAQLIEGYVRRLRAAREAR